MQRWERAVASGPVNRGLQRLIGTMSVVSEGLGGLGHGIVQGMRMSLGQVCERTGGHIIEDEDWEDVGPSHRPGHAEHATCSRCGNCYVRLKPIALAAL